MIILSNTPEISIGLQIIIRVASSALVRSRGEISGFEVKNSASSNLLLVDFQGVSVLHVELVKVSLERFHREEEKQDDGTYSVRGVLGANASSVKEEADSRGLFSLTVAERVHELLQLRRALDLEEDLVVVICHFNVQMLGGGGFLVGHFAGYVCVVLENYNPSEERATPHG